MILNELTNFNIPTPTGSSFSPIYRYMQENELQALLKKLRANTIKHDERVRLNYLLNIKEGVSQFIQEADEVYSMLKAQQNDLPDDAGSPRLRKRLQDTIGASEPAVRHLKRGRPGRIVTMAAATTAVFFLIAAYLFMVRLPSNVPTEWVTVKTNAGQFKEILLMDGTTVKVSGSSTLRYPKSDIAHVRLVQFDGEGFFEVAKDAQRPFIIVSNTFTTHVLGTSFTIDSDIDQKISVMEGKVKVIGVSAEAALQAFLGNNKASERNKRLDARESCILTQGQQALWADGAWTMTEHDRLNWALQDLICTNEPLKQILKKYDRIYGQKVTTDSTLADKRLTISLKHGKPEKVIETLALVMGAKFIKHPNSWEIKK